MRNLQILLLIILTQAFASPVHADSGEGWRIKRTGKCLTHYMPEDLPNLSAYQNMVIQGVKAVESFWGESYRKEFDLFIHPSRTSMDQAWQHEWNMPDFQSQCWMVASGVAGRMDLLSPAIWHLEACEHSYEEKPKTQRLISHELFHVFHGQHNASPDFSKTEGIDWFVEGLATYASGQYDAERKAEVEKAVRSGKAPASLDEFWEGNLRYGLCASLLEFVDQKYGRQKLRSLLTFSTRSEILQTLSCTEAVLLRDWRNYLLSEGL